jgi:predicted dehydrogenase
MAQAVPAVEQSATRWAILGTGVVSRKFVLGLRVLGPAARVTAVASRDPARAQDFARSFAIPFAAPGYAEAVARDDVDAVYVATPPSEHEAHAMLAIAAGKAVLVEKPFALDAGAAARITQAAEAAGVFCMEAMWTRFLPLMETVRGLVAQGALGQLRSLQGSFMGSDLPGTGASLFDPARGGGALMHRGVYPLSLARHLLGPIAGVTALGRRGETGVDEDCSVILRHAGGALTTLTASLRSPGPNDLVLAGTRGLLVLEAPVYRPHRARLTIVTPRDGSRQGGGRLEGLRESGAAQRVAQMLSREGGRVIRRPYAGNGYHYEAAEVARCLAAGQTVSALMPPAESVEIMAAIDAARAQFG